MKKNIVIGLCVYLLVACATTQNKSGPSVEHGFSSAVEGLAHLILSPFQIAAGLLEGIASVPYYLSTDIHAINQGLTDARAKITLNDTYETVYGKRLTEVAANGETGTVFRRMKDATQFFQAVLKQYGVRESERFLLTSIDTANDQGYTLLAVIYRPMNSIQIIDKYDNKLRILTSADRLFYEPFKIDAHGNMVDTVIDWAGMPREVIENQKGQAILLTIAANSVLNNRKSPEYWTIERRWLGGEFQQIVEQRMKEMQSKMGI